MATVKGSAVLLYVFDGTTDVLVGGQTNYDEELAARTFDVASKLDTHEKPVPGKRSGTITLESVWLDSDAGFTLLQNAYANGTQVTVKRFVNGAEEASATGYVTRIRRSAPDNDRATVSVEIVLDSDFA